MLIVMLMDETSAIVKHSHNNEIIYFVCVISSFSAK